MKRRIILSLIELVALKKRMAGLFNVDKSVITKKHLQSIFESKELDEVSVSVKMTHTAGDGKT